MRILVGVHGLAPYSIGGTESVAMDLARNLATHHEVTVFHPLPASVGPPGTEHRLTRSGVRVLGRVFRPPTHFADTYRGLEAETWFRALLASVSPDIVLLHHLAGLSVALPGIARAREIPCVLTLHDYWPVCARGQLMNLAMGVCDGPGVLRCATCLSDQVLMDRPVGRAGRLVLSRFPGLRDHVERVMSLVMAKHPHRPGASDEQGVLTASDGRARAVRDRIAGGFDALDDCSLLTGPSRHILETYRKWVRPATAPRLVRNGVPPRPRVRPARPGCPPLRVGYLGALIPTKGAHLLLEACRGIPARYLDVSLAGPTPLFHRQPDYARRLRALARSTGASLEGPISPGAVPAWLERRHLLVVPSLWMENAPRVIGEAFRLGVPVIASDTGGIPEQVVDGNNGALFPPGDTERLRRLLETLLENPRRVRRWADGAWETHLASPETELLAWEAVIQAAMR